MQMWRQSKGTKSLENRVLDDAMPESNYLCRRGAFLKLSSLRNRLTQSYRSETKQKTEALQKGMAC